ncbi:MAG: hypothetical protein K8T25_19070 [Planctomycetia bacterium]|nr:hypothetical protein [Planctomycetia bacterium]
MQFSNTRMKAVRYGSLLVLGGSLLVLSFTAQAQAASSAGDVSTSVGELQSWLATSKDGAAWQKYLEIDQLKAQIAKGDKADVKQLAEIRQKFRSGAAGLDKRRFAAVSRALGVWIDELTAQSLRPADLPKVAAKIQEQLAPKNAADAAAAKAELRTAVQKLDVYLTANGRKGQAWKQFLKWNLLTTALAAKEPDLAVLKEELDRFEADEDGLEMAQYQAVRNALREYLYTSLAVRNPKAVAAQLEKYDRLFPKRSNFAELLEAYGADATHAASIGVGARLGELERFHEAPAFVSAVRNHWSHPNLNAYLGRNIIAASLGDQLHEQIQVNEDILGTYVEGTGTIQGELTGLLVPDPNKAVLRIVLDGTTKTRTTGYKGPVTISAAGTTKLSGATQITVSRDGLSRTPATGTAVTSSKISDISTKHNGPIGRLIQRKAWEKVGESKAEAEKVAGDRAGAKLRDRMDKQAADSVNKANHDFAYKFRDPLARKDAFPSVLNFSTTDAAVVVVMKQAAANQLAAPTAPTPLSVDHDMGVRLHESLLNNLAATELGGRTITDDASGQSADAKEQSKKIQDKVKVQKARNRKDRFAKMTDDEKKVELARREKADREQKFSVTLARLNPATVELRNDTVKVTIRGVAFEGIDGKKYDEHPMTIWATYHIEKPQDGKLVLEMKDLDKDWGVMTTEAEFGGPAAVGAEALRAKLKARFGDLFLDLYRLEFEPLVLPGKMERAGKLAYAVADAQGGWLTLAWNQMSPKSAAKKVALDAPSSTRQGGSAPLR